MKLGFFITSMNHGGAERVMSILTNSFAVNNHEVHLFIYSKRHNYYKINQSVNVHYIDAGHEGFGKVTTLINHSIGLLKAKQLIKINQLDCLISFTTFINCNSIILGKLTNTPVIISERNDPLYFKGNFFSSVIRKKLYKYATCIVLQTERSEISFDTLKIKLPQKKVVIFNPIDPFFSNNKGQRDEIITVVGRLSFEKGHDLLLKAFANSNYGDWKLHLIGDGIEKDNLVQLAQKLNIENSIVWQGVQKNVNEFLNKSAIYILPSRTEGFPNALCEAMICGCAVISFDCPNGPAEIIANGQNGFLVSAGDIGGLTNALNRLMTDQQLRDRLGNEASKIKNKLNENAIYLEWEALISDLVNEHA